MEKYYNDVTNITFVLNFNSSIVLHCEKCYHYEICSLVDFKRRSKIDFCANYKASNCIHISVFHIFPKIQLFPLDFYYLDISSQC